MNYDAEDRPQEEGCEAERPGYELFLYIAGASPRSQQAVANVRKLCELLPPGVCDLKVVDILQTPKTAKDDQIIAVPALLKKLPQPIRLFIGDLSNKDEILKALKD